MVSPEPLHLSAFLLLFFGTGIFVVLWLLFKVFVGKTHSVKGFDSFRSDWAIKSTFAPAEKSYFHRWDTRAKNASLLFLCFVAALLNKTPLLLFPLFIVLAVILTAKIDLRSSLRRLSALTGFLAMLYVLLPLSVSPRADDLLIYFDPFTFFNFNVRGIGLANKICLKTIVAALLIEIMVGTASFSSTVESFAGLGVPDKICQLIQLTYRYIFVFQQDAERMLTAMRMRGFVFRANLDTLKIWANFLGILFISSYDRTRRVHNAMKARGYRGALPGNYPKSLTKMDWFWGILCFVFGGGLLLIDRI